MVGQVNSTPAISNLESNAIVERSEKRVLQASTAFAWAILLGGIVTIAAAVYMVVVSYSSLPWDDGWIQIDPLVNGINPLSLHWLWAQHDDHRLVITKLFLLADLRMFHARQWFLLTSIQVIQFLFLVVLSWSMRVLGGWRGRVWLAGTGLATFCLFCPSQWHNFVWGFEPCFVLPGLFVTLSFAGLLLYWIDAERQPGKPSAWRFIALSIAAALGATLSLANGNLVWPLLVVAALFLGLRRSVVLSFAATGAVTIALYLHHYVSRQAEANAGSFRGDPLRFLQFVAVYLGSVWAHASPVLAGIFGVAGAGAVCAVVLRSRLYIRTRQAFAIQLVLTLLFCLGTAFATALGRSNFGLSYAFSSRYQTVVLLFWCCLGLMLLGSVAAIKRTRVPFMVVQICLLAIMARGAYLAQYPIREARRHGFQLRVASMALFTATNDWRQVYFGVGVKPDYLMRDVPYLQENHLSIYYGDAHSQLGRPLDAVFHQASPDECAGAVESTTPMEGLLGMRALRITGWAWDYKHEQPPAEVIATSDGIITGLAAVGDWRPAIKAANPQITSSYTGYVGYVRDVNPHMAVKIYAILPGSQPSACYIANNTALGF
jgi:hypothetical protein